MGRSPCCDKMGLKRGTWTSEEDQKLTTYIEQNGHGSWRSLPAKAGLRRCGKSCRLRWNNYLRPDIKRGKFSVKEEQSIIQLHALLGNRWSTIASYLPKRTDNDIKNLWNTHLKKKLTKMGIDPVTHKPRSLATLFPGQEKAAAYHSHTAQWELARLQAEARLTLESKLATIYPTLISPLPPAPAPAVNAPARASYRVENTLSNGYNELMILVGHEASTSVVDKFEGFSHASAIYSDACVSNDYLFRSDQNLTRNINEPEDDCSGNVINGYIESDEFAWNNLVDDGFSSASFAYGDA